MKAALMQCNKIMTLVSLAVILLHLIGLLSAYIAIGLPLGYLTARVLMKKFIYQLDYLAPMELPSSNLVFNMLVYSILFLVTVRIDVVALLSAFVGVIVYRKMFFIALEKKMKEGGFDEHNNWNIWISVF